MNYDSIEEAIDAGETLTIIFKDGNGGYHSTVKKFNSYRDYENYCETRMSQSGWKEIGTDLWQEKKKQ